MLSHAFEFYRIVDAKPGGEVVKNRTASAADLVTQLASKQSRELLLACVNGLVAGFRNGFNQNSPAVIAVIKAIKDHDAAFPESLKENAEELRASAATAIGEILHRQMDKPDRGEGIIAALAIRAGLGLRPTVKEKHLSHMLSALSKAADRLLSSAVQNRRARGVAALRRLEKLEEPENAADVWKTVMPAFKAALREVHAQSAADREEIETLWWMYYGFSEIGQRPVADLPVAAAALCAGVELAQRTLLPPAPSGVEMVQRAVEAGRKPASLVALSLQDAAKEWTDAMLTAVAGSTEHQSTVAQKYPALFPVTWACRRLNDGMGTAKIGKEFTAATGVPSGHVCSPADLGAQVFREKVLERAMTDATGG